ncbi:MAG: hypothetical protein M1840_002609 [Geoglossum simile]|nr:MAG: hypothetical protein M1840_002609 [Geoglossum simile]
MDSIKVSSVEPEIHDASGDHSEGTSKASDVKHVLRPKKSVVKAEGSGDEEVSCILLLFCEIKLLVHEMFGVFIRDTRYSASSSQAGSMPLCHANGLYYITSAKELRKQDPQGEAANTTLKPAKAPKTPKSVRSKGKANSAPAKKRTPKNAVKADDETDLTYEAGKITTPRKKRVDVPNDGNGEPSTPPNKKRRTPAATPSSGRSIPESRDDLDDNDKLLLSMKEQGKTWPEIREAFKNIGITTGASTLPNRYSRLVAKLVEWKSGDVDTFLAVKSAIEAEFLEAKKAMEAKFDAEKWSKISAGMEERGTTRYTSAALQKKLKDITPKGSSRTAGSSSGGPSKTTDSAGPVGPIGTTTATIDEVSGEDEEV